MTVLPGRTLYSSDIHDYAKLLHIPHFIGVKMRDELGKSPRVKECGVLNLNTHLQSGSHWTCWFKNQNQRYYFDSYGEPPPLELLEYLKTRREIVKDLPAVRICSVTVQHDQSNECGALCLYVLKQLALGIQFPSILDHLERRYRKSPTPPLCI